MNSITFRASCDAKNEDIQFFYLFREWKNQSIPCFVVSSLTRSNVVLKPLMFSQCYKNQGFTRFLSIAFLSQKKVKTCWKETWLTKKLQGCVFVTRQKVTTCWKETSWPKKLQGFVLPLQHCPKRVLKIDWVKSAVIYTRQWKEKNQKRTRIFRCSSWTVWDFMAF